MTDSADLVLSDDPWMSHAFISNLMTQVSLPYRRPKAKEIVRHGPGNLTVTFTTTADCLPYGKYPRLFRCIYTIDNSTSSTTEIRNVPVAERAHIDWLSNEPQEHSLFENTVQLNPKYVDYLRDSPVPVDLAIVAKLNSPIALDVYWWLTHRYSYLQKPEVIVWQRLYQQFGSDASLRKFKDNFKKVVAEVCRVYPQATIIGGVRAVTLYPSQTSVPTVFQATAKELEAKQRQRSERAAAKPVEVTEAAIGRVMERLEVADEDHRAARKYVIEGLKSGRPMDDLVASWEEGK